MIIEFCDCTLRGARSREKWETRRIQRPSAQFLLVTRIIWHEPFLSSYSVRFLKPRFLTAITFLRRKLDVGIYFGARSAIGHGFPRPSFTVSLIKHRCRPGRGRARARNESHVSRVLTRIRTAHNILISRFHRLFPVAVCAAHVCRSFVHSFVRARCARSLTVDG